MWPIQLAFLLLLLIGYSCSLRLSVTLLHFSHDRCNWSSPSFSSITFQNFSGISDLLSEVITDISWKYSCDERCISLSVHDWQQDVHYSEILTAKGHLEDVSVDDKVILYWSCVGGCGLDLSGSRYWTWRTFVNPAINLGFGMEPRTGSVTLCFQGDHRLCS